LLHGITSEPPFYGGFVVSGFLNRLQNRLQKLCLSYFVREVR
jgi:hypothetical protein